MSSLYSSILMLGESRTHDEELEKLLNSVDGEKLVGMFKLKLVDAHASRVLGFVFNGLTKTGIDQKKRFMVMEGVLQQLPLQPLTDQHSAALVTRLVLELDALPTDHLVRLTEYCSAQLHKDKPDTTCWKELLPKLLHLLQSKSAVSHHGSEMTGAEYKTQVVQSLCMANWGPDIIIMVADMFSEVPLSEEEQERVSNKLYCGLEQLEPATVPPLVHQLLRVCGDRCCLPLLMHVQQYYANKLGDQEEPQDGISTVDTISRSSLVETKQSEGMVLFHLQQCASLGKLTIQQLLRTLRSLAQAPELIFGGPLLLPSALLMIADSYEEQVLGVLSCALGQALQDEEHRRLSSWVRELVPTQKNLRAVLENIIRETPPERGVVLEGLVKLCFELLHTKRAGRTESTAEQIWGLAAHTLVFLVKHNRDATSTVVHRLVENFVRPKQKHPTQFIRCFQQVVSATAKSRQLQGTLEFLSLYLVEQLMLIQGSVAEQAVLALVPLLQVSEQLCNSLVLVLRKALNVPRVGTRQLAVTGLLLLMQKLKVRRLGGGLGGSQPYDTPCSSISSQTTDVMVHHAIARPVRNPEALCLELLRLLKHCFTLQHPVKLRLYQGCLELVTCNPELAVPVLQFLQPQLKRYLNPEDEDSPLNLDIVCRDSTEEDAAELTEPLGELVLAVSQVHVRVREEDGELKAWVPLLERELLSLSDRMAQCSLRDLGFDEEDMVLEDGAKGSRKLLQLGQILGVYEALIAYELQRWFRAKGDSHGRRITALFKAHGTISDYHKGQRRLTKKKAQEESQQPQAGPSQAPNPNPRKRGRPSAGTTFTVSSPSSRELPAVMDLGSLHLLLALLFREEVEWADQAEAEHVSSKVELNCWALKSLHQSIQQVKSCSLNALMDRHTLTFKHLCDISNVLYQGGVRRLQALLDNHPDIGVLAVESWSELLRYVSSEHRALLPALLTVACGRDDEADVLLGEVAEQLGSLLRAALERGLEDEENQEPSSKRLARVLVAALTQVCKLHGEAGRNLEQVQRLLQEVLQRLAVSDEVVVTGVLGLLVTLHERRSGVARVLALVARHLCHLAGTIEQEEPSMPHKPLALISEAHVTSVALLVCARLRDTLEHLTLITRRLGCERRLLPYLVNQDRDLQEAEIKGKERHLCGSASQLVDVLVLLVAVDCEVAVCESLLKTLSALYVMLTGLCRHFIKYSTKIQPAFRGANFEKVIRAAGKNLTSVVSTFISHVENRQRERQERQQAGKRFNAGAAQKRVQREADCIARAVLEMEKFSKAVLQLAHKTKTPLNEHLHLGVSHDFRINSREVQRALATLHQQQEEEEDEESGSETEHNSRDGTHFDPEEENSRDAAPEEPMDSDD